MTLLIEYYRFLKAKHALKKLEKETNRKKDSYEILLEKFPKENEEYKHAIRKIERLCFIFVIVSYCIGFFAGFVNATGLFILQLIWFFFIFKDTISEYFKFDFRLKKVIKNDE